MTWFAPTAATIAIGLGAVYVSARRITTPVMAAWTVAALLFATALWPTLLSSSPAAFGAAVSFAAAAVAVWLVRKPMGGPLVRGGAAALWLGALAVPYAMAGALPHPSLAGFGDALFSSSHGLLFWSPLLWLGVFGLARLARAESGRGPVMGVGVLVAGLLASGRGGNGPVAGGRFHPALPLLGLGVAVGLESLRDAIERRPALPLVAAGAALTVWNFLFMEQYRTGLIPRDLPVSFAEVTEKNAAVFSRAFGSPTAWPVNWLFAWRHEVTPAKYDVVVGQGPWSKGFLAIDDPRVDPHLLAEGWDVRTSCGAIPCRHVLGSARILLPLSSSGPFPTALRVAGPAGVMVRLNRQPLISDTLGAVVVDLSLPKAPGTWVDGVNEITITSVPADAVAVLGLCLNDLD